MAVGSAPTRRFRAKIKLNGPNPYVDVPASVSDAFHPWAVARRVTVEGRLNRTPIRATLVPVRHGGHRLYVNGGIRAAANVRVGDEVSLTLKPIHRDDVNPPADVTDALSKANSTGAFATLEPSHQRELLRYIDDARSAAGRAKRISTMIADLNGRVATRDADHAARSRPLWTCPDCGNQFVTRNQYHSCGRHHVDDAFVGKPSFVRDLFERVRAFIETNGPTKVVAYRDRVAFMARVRFAGVTPKARWLDLTMWLPQRVDSDRWHRIETLSSAATIHTLRLTSADQLDDEVARWLAQAYAVGCQSHLARGSPRPRPD